MRIATASILGILCIACHKETRDAPPEPPMVHVKAVETATLSEWLRLPGRVVPPPDRDATLSFRVDGVVSQVEARIGERVVRGRVLATVDTVPLSDALIAAEAAEASSAADAAAKRRVADRTRALATRGVLAGEQAESDEAAALAAEAAHSQARAARDAAARRRGWAELTAPFDGVVVRILRHAGETVDGTAATPVLELAGGNPLEIALEAPASALSRLRVGQEAEVAPEAGKPATIPARVANVAAAVDPATGTGPVRIAPERQDAALILGRIVEARIVVGRHAGVLVVPAAALRDGASGTTEAVVVSDHVAHARTVRTGLREDDRVEIVSGLEAGDLVVGDDVAGLLDGAQVRDTP